MLDVRWCAVSDSVRVHQDLLQAKTRCLQKGRYMQDCRTKVGTARDEGEIASDEVFGTDLKAINPGPLQVEGRTDEPCGS